MEAGTAGLLGALVGACVSIATTFLSNRHTIKLQASADSIERQEKARAFQRDNLLACQEMTQVIGRLTTQVFHEDAMALRRGIAWGNHIVTEQVDQDLAANRRKFSTLIERVADDELRKELKAVSRLLNNVTAADSLGAAESALNTATTANQKTMELLGVVLRSTY
jgi:HAMP domain-containing protein